MLDKYLCVNVTLEFARYERHCRNHPMLTIGYCSKSKGKERVAKRCSLLNDQITRLNQRTSSTQVYVSPFCDADEPLISRDQKNDNTNYLQLIQCDGTMKGTSLHSMHQC